jgi:MFS family permease
MKKINNPFLETLRNKNFLKIWGSQLLSQITVNLLNFILILEIFQQTESTVAVSLFWFFWSIPAIFIGPLSGTLIDLWGTRRVLILTNLFQSLIVLLYLSATSSIWPIYTILMIYSILNQFYLPAEAATIPSVVPQKLLSSANSLFLSTSYLSLVIGFGLAGTLVRLLGYQIPFILGSLFLILAALLVWRLPKITFVKPTGRLDTSKFQEFLSKLIEGYQFIKTNPTVLFPLLLLVFSQIIIVMLFVLGPALIVKILDDPFVRIGEAFILPGAFGAIVGMGLVVKLLKKIRKRYLIHTGLFLSSFTLFSLVLILPYFSSFFKIIGQMGFGFMAGLSFSLFTIPTQTLLQEKTPLDLRGRVFGVLGFLVTIVSVFPVLFAAAIGEFLGERWMILILAMIVFALGVFSLKGENVLKRFYRARNSY